MKKSKLTIEGRKARNGRLFVLPFYIGFVFIFMRNAYQSLIFIFKLCIIQFGGDNRDLNFINAYRTAS